MHIGKSLGSCDSTKVQLRGATPCPRSGAAAGRSYPASEVRGGGREELSHIQGQGWWSRVPGYDSTGAAKRRYAPGQGQWPGGASPHPASGACTGAGGPRGATTRSRTGGAAVRRYPSSKVRSSGCTLWSSREEIPHVQGKRNPSKMVGVVRGHQRADALKP